MISLDNVTYSYNTRDENGKIVNSKTAINNLSLTIDSGSFVCIVGKNGSGKSTLARILNGILIADEGEIYIGNEKRQTKKDLNANNGDDESTLLRYSNENFVAMVFQNPDNQIVASVVEEDVAFGLENICIESSKIRTRVDWALEIVGMSQYKRYSPNKLSGGQKQRVAIAGAIAMKPKYLILDEPTSMLDPKGRVEILNTIKKLNKDENITIILITHCMEETVYSDKIYVMNDGQIVMQGKPKEIFTKTDEIYKLKLDLPFATKMTNAINLDGYKIREDNLTIEELAQCF